MTSRFHRCDAARQGAQLASDLKRLGLFRAFGVPVVEFALAHAPDCAHSLPYPVAVKIVCAEIAHETETGGTLAELYNDVVLREAEANPVIVKPDGVVAVDALAVMKEA